MIRAWQRTVSSGTELRLVVTAKIVSRVLHLRGLDRLVSVYPFLEAAMAAKSPAAAAAMSAVFPATALSAGNGTTAVRAQAGALLDGLQDAMALTDGDGMIAAASAWMEDMFGYGRGELPGLPAESLVPAGLQEPQRDRRAGWALMRSTRPMDVGAQLAGLHEDGTTFPVRVSLTRVTTAAGQFTFAVIRDAEEADRLEGLVGMARGAAAAQQEHLRLLGAVITGLSHAGLSLQASLDMPADAARQRTEEVLGDLDDIIRQIRHTAFPAHDQPVPPPRPRLPAVTCNAGGRSQAAHGAGIPRRGPRPTGMPADAGKNTFSRPPGQWTT